MNKTLNEQKPRRHPQRSPWWMALFFAINILSLGMVAAAWGYWLKRLVKAALVN